MANVTYTDFDTGVLGRLTGWLRARIDAARDRRAQRMSRKAFANVLTLDDQMLKDIGVTRAEVEWAARLPVDVSAGAALEARAQARRERERDLKRR